MIIYCTGPVSDDPARQKHFSMMIKYIETLGHSVLSEASEKFTSTIPLTDNQVYKRDLKWIDGSKVMIAEVSSRGFRAGFEIAYAIFKRKLPVLALYDWGIEQMPAMISGNDSPLLTVHKYQNDEDMKKIISQFLSIFVHQ